jgi:hypothetical protein
MASSSLRAMDAPPGFKWILVCKDCKYCYCFDCLTYCIKSSPACKDILNKWVQSYNHFSSYTSYFRPSHNIARGIITGGPMQGQIYIYIYTPCISYEDYCAIMLQTKYDGSCWILFECSTFKESHLWWSGWLYLLFGLTAPEIFCSLVAVKMHSNTSFVQRLKKQLTMKHGLYLTYHFKEASLFMKSLSPHILKLTRSPVNFMEICVFQTTSSLPAMQGSPFYKCFSDCHLFLTFTGLLLAVTTIMTVVTHLILLLSTISIIGWKHDGPFGS